MLFTNEKEILDRLASDENILNLLERGSEGKVESHIPSESSDEEEDEVDVQALIAEPKPLGRPRGAKNRSMDDRAELAVMSDLLGTSAVQELFGVSSYAPSVHSRGKVNQSDLTVKPSLLNRITNRKNQIRNISTKKLKEVLEVIDDQTIENLRGNAIKATTVATNLARVVEKMEPKEVAQKNTANFIIMQPTIASEKDYDVIDV